MLNSGPNRRCVSARFPVAQVGLADMSSKRVQMTWRGGGGGRGPYWRSRHRDAVAICGRVLEKASRRLGRYWGGCGRRRFSDHWRIGVQRRNRFRVVSLAYERGKGRSWQSSRRGRTGERRALARHGADHRRSPVGAFTDESHHRRARSSDLSERHQVARYSTRSGDVMAYLDEGNEDFLQQHPLD
jgi:hypothetical protein